MPDQNHKVDKLTREARDLADRHGVKMYEPLVDPSVEVIRRRIKESGLTPAEYAKAFNSATLDFMDAGIRKARAERDWAIGLLEDARQALERIAGEIPHASASRSARRSIAKDALAHIDAAQKARGEL